MRAVLVAIVIAIPALLLPDTSEDTAQVVTLAILIASTLTFVEYTSSYPGLVEFRDAPPFNRVRYLSLFLTVLLLSLITLGKTNPSTLTQFVEILGNKVAQSVDFQYSPVRVIWLIVPEGASAETFDLARAAAGLAYMISLVTLAAFVLLARMLSWPGRDGGFNIWVNLPTFDPSSSSDIVRRLNRDARFNVILGFAIPFLIPILVDFAAAAFDPITLTRPLTLIWTMTLWAFLPTSMFMRGIAMWRIADMISHRRRQSLNAGGEAGMQLV